MPEYFGPNLPSVRQLERRTKLALIAANPIIDNLGPMQPNVIPVGGIHIKKPKAIPNVRFNSFKFKKNKLK